MNEEQLSLLWQALPPLEPLIDLLVDIVTYGLLMIVVVLIVWVILMIGESWGRDRDHDRHHIDDDG
jgi:hypothetical protein